MEKVKMDTNVWAKISRGGSIHSGKAKNSVPSKYGWVSLLIFILIALIAIYVRLFS